MPKRVSKQTHLKQKARYYKKYGQWDILSKTRWPEHHIKMVLEHKIKDIDIARLTGRSLQAVQHKRSVLKKIKKGE